MHYRFITILACFISLQSRAVTEESELRNVQTETIQCKKNNDNNAYVLYLLPTSEPTTPKEKFSLRRVQTDYNFLSKVSLRATYEAEKLSLIRAYIKELQEQKLAHSKNNCGYFPHLGNEEETNYSYDSYRTISDSNFYCSARNHMDF